MEQLARRSKYINPVKSAYKKVEWVYWNSFLKILKGTKYAFEPPEWRSGGSKADCSGPAAPRTSGGAEGRGTPPEKVQFTGRTTAREFQLVLEPVAGQSGFEMKAVPPNATRIIVWPCFIAERMVLPSK